MPVGEYEFPDKPLNNKKTVSQVAANPFQKAEKHGLPLRMCLQGPSKAGKTYSALKFASCFDGKIALVDTEHGTAKLYADEFDFDTIELTSFGPDEYTRLIHLAEENGYTTIIIDSLSHAWAGKGGLLDLADQAAKRSRSGNTFQAWGEVKPEEQRLWEALKSTPCHLIVTLRTKTEYLVEQNAQGKSVPRKVGLAPIQRADSEYEFDLVGDMDHENNVSFAGRCKALKGKLFNKPGKEVMDIVIPWLGTPEAESPVAAVAPEPTDTEQESVTDEAPADNSDIDFPPKEDAPVKTLAERCETGEDILKEAKVKGFMTGAQIAKTRLAQCNNKVLLPEASDEDLKKYLTYLQETIDSLPE